MNTSEKFLLSLPNMGDNNFRSAVVYVEKHDGDGAKVAKRGNIKVDASNAYIYV